MGWKMLIFCTSHIPRICVILGRVILGRQLSGFFLDRPEFVATVQKKEEDISG